MCDRVLFESPTTLPAQTRSPPSINAHCYCITTMLPWLDASELMPLALTAVALLLGLIVMLDWRSSRGAPAGLGPLAKLPGPHGHLITGHWSALSSPSVHRTLARWADEFGQRGLYKAGSSRRKFETASPRPLPRSSRLHRRQAHCSPCLPHRGLYNA